MVTFCQSVGDSLQFLLPVIGLKGGSMACFTCDCQTHNCEHVLKLTASEEELVPEMPDF